MDFTLAYKNRLMIRGLEDRLHIYLAIFCWDCQSVIQSFRHIRHMPLGLPPSIKLSKSTLLSVHFATVRLKTMISYDQKNEWEDQLRPKEERSVMTKKKSGKDSNFISPTFV